MKGFGWKGHIKDSRDYPYRAIAKAVDVPMVYDGWKHFMLDQGDLGSCGPHSAVAHLSAVIKQNNMPDPSWYALSPLALYYFYREFTGEVNEDTGVYNRVMLQVMQKVGVCTEQLWPYDLGKWKIKPPQEAYDDAAKRQTLKYYLISGIDEMINAVAEGYGFLGGMPVYKSFLYVTPDNPIIPMPGPHEEMLGGHDLYFHSYDKHMKVFWLQNSWGTEWGKAGHGALPFEYAMTMLDGCYTVRLLEG